MKEPVLLSVRFQIQGKEKQKICQSILIIKTMAGCYDMGTHWFQIALENSCALDKMLTFNQTD